MVVGWGLIYLAGHPDAFSNWSAAALLDYGSPASMIIGALLVFPKLALGLRVRNRRRGDAARQGDPGDTATTLLAGSATRASCSRSPR